MRAELLVYPISGQACVLHVCWGQERVTPLATNHARGFHATNEIYADHAQQDNVNGTWLTVCEKEKTLFHTVFTVE